MALPNSPKKAASWWVFLPIIQSLSKFCKNVLILFWSISRKPLRSFLSTPMKLQPSLVCVHWIQNSKVYDLTSNTCKVNRACLCHSNLIVKTGVLLVCFLYNPQFFNKFFVRESWWFWWFPFPTTQYLPNHCVQLLIHLRVVTAFASAFVHISEQSQSSFSFLSNLSSNQVNTEFEQVLGDIHFHFMLDFWIRFIQTWTPIFF